MTRKEELKVLIKSIVKDIKRLTETMCEDDNNRFTMLDDEVLKYQHYRNELKSLK